MKDPLKAHQAAKGKVEIRSKAPLKRREDLSLWYTPGVGQVSAYLAKNPDKAREYTWKNNSVLVVSDGSAVLGLGNIGPYAALPVMEGKAMIFREFAGVDAVPVVLATQKVEEIVDTIANIAPGFGGINIEDISAPRCFEVELRLKARLDIPVFHDDQHGTAIVVLAGLLNALKVAGKKLQKVKIVVLGAGAAGNSIVRILHAAGAAEVVAVDSRAIISRNRTDLDVYKRELADITNPHNLTGDLKHALHGADVFIGVARGGLVSAEMVRSMAPNPVIFALSNPVPEIMPEEAKRAGAYIVATGRSDYPNQINNALVFPGIFRGALDRRVKDITTEMNIRAAKKLAALVADPSPQRIIPSPFDKGVVKAVSSAIK